MHARCSAVIGVQDSEAEVVEVVVVAEGLVDQGLTASLLGAFEAVPPTTLQVTGLRHHICQQMLHYFWPCYMQHAADNTSSRSLRIFYEITGCTYLANQGSAVSFACIVH